MYTKITLVLLLLRIAAQASPSLPLKASSDHRYLVGQNNVPFLLLGDSPQSMLINLSLSQMATYMADRHSYKFNAILVMALCDSYTAGYSNGATYDGIAPFTSGSSPSDYDLATPNPTYFARLDGLVSLAASYDLVVFFDPIETGGWLTTLENNGTTKAFNFGAYLGNRYKQSPNIVWESGNDFQSWNSSTTDNALVDSVMAGIASVDSSHLQSIELNYLESYSNQAAGLRSVLTLDATYTYYETYDEVLQAYNSLPTMPTFLTEANYEYENGTRALPDPAGVFVLREQEYWAMTSGACGQLYGNHYTWTLDGPDGSSSWTDFLDSPGAHELLYWYRLFSSVPWWRLVPDQGHQIVTSGYGTYNGSNKDLPTANYVTTAWLTNGTLAVIYNPAGNMLTVDLGKFSHAVDAKWYDPSDGMFTLISGSPFPNVGFENFSTPGNNHDGQSDWVLELSALDTSAAPTPVITSKPANPTNRTSASFSFTDTEAGVRFLCQLDGSGFSTCTSPMTYAGPLTQGSYSFLVKAEDAAGNRSLAASYHWTIDTTPPPTPTITSNPANPTNQTSASFGFSDTEAGVSFLCQLDGGAFSSCTSPQVYAGPLSQGSHTFAVEAQDKAGNQSSATSFTWTIN